VYVTVAVLCSLVVGRAVVYWFSSRMMAKLESRTLGKKGIISDAHKDKLSYVFPLHALYVRHLFCPTCSVNPPVLVSTGNPTDAATNGPIKTKLPLSIAGGIIWHEDPKIALATLIDRRPDSVRTYQVRTGTSLPDFDVKVRLTKDKVWFKFIDGHEEYLEEGQVPQTVITQSAQVKNPTLVNEMKEGVRCSQDGYSCEVNAGVFKKLLSDPSQVLTGAMVKGAKDGNGNPTGLNFRGISSSSFFYFLGLRAGDTLTEINGIGTKDEGSAMEAYGKLKNDPPKQFRVVVNRGGNLVTFDFQVK